MALRLPILSLSLLLLARTAVHAQQLTADDFFHGGAQSYLSNNVPKALDIVTNARAIYPNDIKLKKLEELLKQQNQQQQQQQNQQQQDQSQKEQDKKDQQQKNKSDEQKQQDQQKQQQAKSEKDKQKSGQPQKAQTVPAGQMSPEQAKRLLDAQKGEEEALVLKPQGKPENPDKPVKDW
jgi:outer membrane biosynthesis protein TonB